ncbi:MAG: sensor protein [Gemmatimonadetes bacterium]|jgi:signal transduction histidine kinase|nr:sensor protein [Gemmatimonadota bacterium]
MQSLPYKATGGRTADTYESLGIGSASTHAVQFYENDEFLVTSVGDYLATGLAVGQPVVAVTTEAHRLGITDHLRDRGFDVKRAVQRGQLVLVDADALLASFMVNGHPDAELCRAAVGGLLRAYQSRVPRVTIRVFGEMVDVLCRSGNLGGALELEELWNDMARTYSFSLLCGYSMRTFASDAHTDSVSSICAQHAHVIPTERFLEVQPSNRMREVAMLQQRAQALESEVQRRDTLEQSLRVALAKAEAANRAKNQFLSVMSHELRTPLNAIGGHVQLVEMELLGPINDRQRDSLGRVQRSQRQLLGLINDVLNLARLDASQVKYAAEPVSFAPLIAEVIGLVEPMFAASSLTCAIDLAAEETLIARADREKVQQVLLNLLGNAVKFTPAGGHVTMRTYELPDCVVAIEVRDSGIGMAADKLDSVFEPFVQMAGAAAGQKDGVGLGLAISRRLARGMGGELVAASVIGAGSTFTLTLPRC